ncbi:hypothetical protein X927_09220 [Petrotoga mexicana DSM 14811]|uniref:Uncharacterized protein n=1 Tax=Petrotoga mexicana DSM 14811 TaxID=1122954 RepID=A0A2K1P6L9_9BACT|nr:hypothetical protein X927_09220 [Petrotoga mexicana DSM 14811]
MQSKVKKSFDKFFGSFVFKLLSIYEAYLIIYSRPPPLKDSFFLMHIVPRGFFVF